MVRAVMLEAELAQTREAHAAGEREIMELIDEQDWLRRLSPSSLVLLEIQWIEHVMSWSPDQDVLVASVLRQSRNTSGSQSLNHVDEAVSESSQNRQSEPIREATARPERATHKVIENFMIKMTELLETLMATRQNEQVPATGADEAL
ncbi:hypothetical protein M9H77_17250 [Catharanthus roseus]|uniref:Uncharacterized protein n=1 Tax=Catharanthus roseus TaxID=4058 RepID=A0ACC0B426_CATRO|nr:hypothetical protein M9H77_17250 [Catharanthus roseus]